MIARLCRSASSLLMLPALVGCAIVFVQPPAQPDQSAPVRHVVAPTVPVTIDITPFGFRQQTFRVWEQLPNVDGPAGIRDLTSSFTIQSNPGSGLRATGTLQLAPGDHQLLAEACWWLDILFFLPPNPAPRGCSTSTTYVRVVAPTVKLGSASLTLDAGGSPSTTITVELVPPASSTSTVTLTSPLTSPVTTSVPAGQLATSPPIPALTAGANTLTASGPAPFAPATIPVTVRPRLSAVAPTSAAPGATVTVSGQGFVAPMSVRFGSTPATAVVTSSTSATVTVPASLAAGALQLGVTSAQQSSATTLPFTVLAGTGPGPGSLLLFRSHATGIDIVRFTPGPNAGTLVRVGGVASAVSPGLTVVGLDRKGTTLLRAGSQSLEVFTIGGTLAAPTLSLATAAPSTGVDAPSLSGSGTAAAIGIGVFVRGTGFGIETWPAGSVPLSGKQANSAGGGATAGQALLADPVQARVLRSTPSSLEVWDTPIGAAPARAANNIGVFSAQTVPGLAWVTPGSRLVRSHSLGLEVIDANLAPTPPTLSRIGSNSTGGGTFGAIAVANGGMLAARAVGPGLEIYSLATPTAPTKCGISTQGDAGPSGVALVASGSVVFRATATSIEAYDLSGLSCPAGNVTTALTLPFQVLRTGLGQAPTGLGLAGPD